MRVRYPTLWPVNTRVRLMELEAMTGELVNHSGADGSVAFQASAPPRI